MGLFKNKKPEITPGPIGLITLKMGRGSSYEAKQISDKLLQEHEPPIIIANIFSNLINR